MNYSAPNKRRNEIHKMHYLLRVLVLTFISGTAVATPVTFTGAGANFAIYDNSAGPGNPPFYFAHNATYSTTGTHFDQEIAPSSHISLGLNLQTGASGAYFGATVGMSRSGNANQQSTLPLEISFTVNTESTFTLEGGMGYSGSGNSSLGFVMFRNGGIIFRDDEQSFNVASESFTIGEANESTNSYWSGLGTWNYGAGVISGTLLTGNYKMAFNPYLVETNGGDSGASASGQVALTIGEPPITAVPVPGGLVLFLSGLTAMLTLGKTRRK